MNTHHETGFGARLRNAQDLHTFISGFAGYDPPRITESVTGFDSFLNDLVAINTAYTTSFNHYTMAVTKRTDGIKGKNGAKKILSLILGAVQSQYGKSSLEYHTILGLIRRIRSSERIYTSSASGDVSFVSTSAQSYGSFTQFFNDIVTSLDGFTAYNPSNPAITIVELSNTCSLLNDLNNNIATSFLQLKNARSLRTENYRELSDRVQRIKAYVKAQYGNTSNEYKMITAIKV